MLGEYIGKTQNLNLVGQNFLEKVKPKLRHKSSVAISWRKQKWLGEECTRETGQHTQGCGEMRHTEKLNSVSVVCAKR